MNRRSSVIADELVRDAFQRGRLHIDIAPGDIITAQARETADRLGIQLLNKPSEQPVPYRTDGTTAARRVMYRHHPGWEPPTRVPYKRPRKISNLALIGAGGVGSHLIHLVTDRQVASEISLIDILPGAAEAIALDLQHASGITGSGTRLRGGTEMSLAADADVIVVTAGRPRTPGMSRSDLQEVNARVIRGIAESISAIAPNSTVIVVSNPVDEMTSLMLDITGFARARVIGMAGTLDSARFRDALAQAAGVAVEDVSAITLGSHGDEMVPIASKATIRGRPLREFLSDETIEQCRQKTIGAGAAVVSLRKTGSATLAPAHATMELIEHMCGARTGLVPASVRLVGEYGIKDTVLGVPCRLGMSGVVEVTELQLTDTETAELQQAAEAIRARIGSARK